MELEQKIEAVLFYRARPVKIATLLKFFAVPEEELGNALASLEKNLRNRGVRLVVSDNKEVLLATAPEAAELVESLRKDDLKRDIGAAGAETLAIILYRGPIGRAEIDRVRGVNSSFILRNLMIRGLIERSGADSGKGFSYQVTTTLMTHLGISQKESLPDYETVAEALDEFSAKQEEVT